MRKTQVNRNLRRRKALAGIISSLFLFVLLFIVGGGLMYQLFNLNRQYVEAGQINVQLQQTRLSEGLEVSPYPCSTSNANCTLHNLLFNVTNTGSVIANVIGYFVYYTDLSGNPRFSFTDLSASPLLVPPSNSAFHMPVYANSLPANCVIVTGAAGKAQTCTLDLVTKRGNSFLGQFPTASGQTVVNISIFNLLLGNKNFLGNLTNAGNAVLANATGALAPDFRSFSFFCSQASCEDHTGGFNAAGYQGSAVPLSATYTAFQIVLSNHDPLKRNLSLNENSQIIGVCAQCGGGSNPAWYISGNVTAASGDSFVNVPVYNPNPAPSSGTLHCQSKGVNKFCTIPYGKSAVLTFGGNQPCSVGETCPSFGPVKANIGVGNLVSMEMVLDGNFSGSVPFAQTIPYQGTYSTGVGATLSGTGVSLLVSGAGHGDYGVSRTSCPNNTCTVTATLSPGWLQNTPLSVYWIIAPSHIGATRNVTELSVGAQNPFPDCSAGCTQTFQVPTNSFAQVGHYYEVEITDGQNVAYETVYISS